MKRQIKSSFLSLKDLNPGKKLLIKEFISEYADAVRFYADHIWNNPIEWKVKVKRADETSYYKQLVFDLQNDILDCPPYISTVKLAPANTKLSQRALKAAATQACGIIKSAVKYRKKLLFVFRALQEEKKRTRNITAKLRQNPLIKPNLVNIFPELASTCCKYSEVKTISYFEGIITLSSLGKHYGKILIPVNHHKHSLKLAARGQLLNSFQILPNNISFRYEMQLPQTKEFGQTVGADQGITTCLTFSDGQITPKDLNNQDLHSILTKLKPKRKGSKSFHKVLDQRNNYINWSISQLDFSNIKEIRLEKLTNFRQGKHAAKMLNYFGEPLIRRKLIDFALQNGVHVVEQSSAYRSKRCSKCGFVSSKNRKGKSFSCKHCFFRTDADYNASCNHEVEIPSAKWILEHPNKPTEFFWKEEGFFYLDGSALVVPDSKKR